MILEFLGELIAAMRKYAGLEQEELGKRLGMTVAQIQRLEDNTRKTAIKVELMRQIVKATGVTNRIVAEILAETASKHLDVRLAVLPKDALVPSNHVSKALRMFSTYARELDDEARESIGRMADDLRCHDAEHERLSNSVAKDIIRQINDARRRRGEDPSDDSEG